MNPIDLEDARTIPIGVDFWLKEEIMINNTVLKAGVMVTRYSALYDQDNYLNVRMIISPNLFPEGAEGYYLNWGDIVCCPYEVNWE